MDHPYGNPEQPKSNQDTLQSESTPVRVDSEKQQERKTSVSARNEDYPEDHLNRQTKAFWEWLKSEKIPAHGWITALSSIALLIVTLGQLVVACNNARDTSPLVGYAQKTSDAADRFANAASGINGGVGKAATQLEIQSGNLGANVTQTRRLANETHSTNQNAFASDRPWLAIVIEAPNFVEGAKAIAYINTINTGKRPAKLLDTRYQGQAYRGPLPDSPNYPDGSDGVSTGILVPGQPANAQLDISTYTASPWWNNIQGPVWTYYVYAYARYEDIADHSIHHTWACAVYRPAISGGTPGGFYGCSTYGNAD